jgi:hypothetical protein
MNFLTLLILTLVSFLKERKLNKKIKYKKNIVKSILLWIHLYPKVLVFILKSLLNRTNVLRNLLKASIMF